MCMAQALLYKVQFQGQCTKGWGLPCFLCPTWVPSVSLAPHPSSEALITLDLTAQGCQTLSCQTRGRGLLQTTELFLNKCRMSLSIIPKLLDRLGTWCECWQTLANNTLKVAPVIIPYSTSWFREESSGFF